MRHLKGGVSAGNWQFDSLTLPFDGFTFQNEDLNSLSAVIDGGLSGSGYVLLEVAAFARMGEGQEVFPSQELILGKGSSAKPKGVPNAYADE